MSKIVSLKLTISDSSKTIKCQFSFSTKNSESTIVKIINIWFLLKYGRQCFYPNIASVQITINPNYNGRSVIQPSPKNYSTIGINSHKMGGWCLYHHAYVLSSLFRLLLSVFRETKCKSKYGLNFYLEITHNIKNLNQLQSKSKL